jgi:hypothetical protein
MLKRQARSGKRAACNLHPEAKESRFRRSRTLKKFIRDVLFMFGIVIQFGFQKKYEISALMKTAHCPNGSSADCEMERLI